MPGYEVQEVHGTSAQMAEVVLQYTWASDLVGFVSISGARVADKWTWNIPLSDIQWGGQIGVGMDTVVGPVTFSLSSRSLDAPAVLRWSIGGLF